MICILLVPIQLIHDQKKTVIADHRLSTMMVLVVNVLNAKHLQCNTKVDESQEDEDQNWD